MRTQIAKTWYLPAEYISPTFLTRTPSPFCAGSSWGLLSRKIFYFFLNPLSTRSDYTSILILFFRFRYRTRFDCWFDSRFILVWLWFRIYFISFTIFDSDYNLGFCVFDSIFRLIFTRWILLASISTCFSIADSTLWLFNS